MYCEVFLLVVIVTWGRVKLLTKILRFAQIVVSTSFPASRFLFSLNKNIAPAQKAIKAPTLVPLRNAFCPRESHS